MSKRTRRFRRGGALAAALPGILDGLQAQGYRFVTSSQMLARLGVQRPAPLTAAAPWFLSP